MTGTSLGNPKADQLEVLGDWIGGVGGRKVRRNRRTRRLRLLIGRGRRTTSEKHCQEEPTEPHRTYHTSADRSADRSTDLTTDRGADSMAGNFSIRLPRVGCLPATSGRTPKPY